jgi:hypothetical protein
MRRLLLIAVLAGCQSGPGAAPPPDPDAARRPPEFADGGGLPDGTVVRLDAAPPLADAATFNDGGMVCRSGSVSGVVCAPQGDTPIAGADILATTRDCDGHEIMAHATSNAAGFFRLEGLAPGPVEVTLRSGNFLAVYETTVVAGADLPLSGGVSSKVCLQSSSAKIAILTGEYDRIQDVVGGLGFQYDLLCGDLHTTRTARALLLDWDALRQYDVLFVNCGTGIDLRSTNPETRQIIENLRRFVAGGGSVYVSDLAADFVQAVWPGFVEMDEVVRPVREEPACCVCGPQCPAECVTAPRQTSVCPLPDDEPPECAGEGLLTLGHGRVETVRAVLRDERLRAYLPDEAVDIRFPLGGWMQITGVSPDVQVLVDGAPDSDEPGRPLMVLFQPSPGGGRVAYTSFHNDDQATQAMRTILAALIFRL